MKFVLNTCCNCIELKSGCFFIAYFRLIISFIWIVELLIKIGQGAPIFINQSLIMQMTTAEVWLLLFNHILFFSFTIVLLIGLHKERLKFIKMYLIFGGLVFAIQLAAFVVTIIKFHMAWQYVLMCVLDLPLFLYLWWVILSYYVKLRNTSQRTLESNAV